MLVLVCRDSVKVCFSCLAGRKFLSLHSEARLAKSPHGSVGIVQVLSTRALGLALVNPPNGRSCKNNQTPHALALWCFNFFPIRSTKENWKDTTGFSRVEPQLLHYSFSIDTVAKKLKPHEAKACGVYLCIRELCRREEIEAPQR